VRRMTLSLTLTLAAAAAAAAVNTSCRTAAAEAQQPNTVTYVGNSGFLLRAGGKKILIDAIFDGFPGGYTVPAAVTEPLLAGRAPYDGIDLILATHRHADHFSAPSVRRVLEASPGAVFVGPDDAVAPLADLGNRARALDVPEGERRTVEVNGITIVAMRLSHGNPPAGRPGIVNLAYLVTAGGVKFFHTGDIDLNSIPRSYLVSLRLWDDSVDVAFVPHFLLSIPDAAPFVTEAIRPRFVVASHAQYTGQAPDSGQIMRNHPNAVLLTTEGASWTVR